MPISVACTGCGKKFKAKDALAGRNVPCPGCGASLTIGEADPEALAAALLMNEDASPRSPAESPAPREDDSDGYAMEAPPAPKPEPPRPVGPRKKKPITAAEVRALPPLKTEAPPTWLRHLHWLLVLCLIPLAVSLLQASDDRALIEKFEDAIDHLPPGAEARIDSIEDLFNLMPDHKLKGALLPRDSKKHWLFTFCAGLLFFGFLAALCIEGSAKVLQLLAVALFTATVGVFFLFFVQFLAEWSQRVIVIPRSIIGLLFWIVKFIGFSYRAALDPDNGFLLSFLGFTLGVGFCEEVCKIVPVFFKIRETDGNETWRCAFLWGLASGAGFGLAEAIVYSGDFYNGIHGLGIYLVRNFSCVALHAIWTGAAAIAIHRKWHVFEDGAEWYEWLLRLMAVIAVPMVLHGLYDTCLKKGYNGAALLVAFLSFGYLAYQISLLRGGDDKEADERMLKEYKRRRKAMEGGS